MEIDLPGADVAAAGHRDASAPEPREERTEDKRPEGYRSEFHYGSLTRSIRLPEGATEADVKATYKDGILEVRVPAPKPAAPATGTKIPISRS